MVLEKGGLDCHPGEKPGFRRRPDESREPSLRLDPGFHREPWIPAFAGMTNLVEFQLFTSSLILGSEKKLALRK
jgi:hypothetical protein